MKSMQKNQSLDNLSRDSGVMEMESRSGHSRSGSNATSCYSNDTGFNDQQFFTDPILIIDRLGFKRKFCHFNVKSLIILLSILLSLLALILYGYLPMIVQKIIQSIIKIEPSGEFYDFWQQSKEPTEVGLHFFHIENPWAVEQGLEPLKVKETGRYFFKQQFVRDVNSFNADQSLYIDENFLFSSLLYHGFNDFIREKNHRQQLFINTTVRQLLYGYRLNMLDTMSSIEKFFKGFGLKIDLVPKELFPNEKFGILNGRNGTPDGPYEMFTGFKDTHHKFGYIKTWKNKTKLNFWKSHSCNAINGSDGTIWPAGIKISDRLNFFIPDICRSLYVTFQEKSFYKGIPTYLFSAPDGVLAGKYTNPENECFCIEEEEDLAKQRCIDGIFDLSGCQNGVPVIVSLPHFLGADSRITDEIIGLEPDPTKHRPELHIEPTMGLVIHGDSRLQMSIRVTPNENMIGFNKLRKELYIPIFWGYKKLGMSDETAANLHRRLFTPVKTIKAVLIFFMMDFT
ncbi:CD36-like protein 5 [Sarcoptes scabiei]|uniref:CD36-like protein 5 n=1 Tax=Sarcoptes scabiei TaxID=52283 RepID=A0A132A5M5_SARSC|nr:CD36-like protein 5 [Sarcoptes scabiei]